MGNTEIFGALIEPCGTLFGAPLLCLELFAISAYGNQLIS